MSNTPRLRFPGFTGEWSEKPLGDILFNRRILQNISKSYPLLSFTSDMGVIDGATKKIDRSFLTHDKENKKYLLTKVDDIVYNPANLKFGAIHRNTFMDGVVSPIYVTLETNENPYFVDAIVTSSSFRKEALKFEEGTVVARQAVSPEDLLSICVSIPSPAEQQKIADCLSSLDDLVAAQGEKVEVLKEQKKGLMQQLFPQNGETTPRLRFPGFTGEWQEKRFDECFEIGSGRDYKHLSDGEIPVYGSGGYMCSVNDFLYDGESACIGRKGTINNPIFLRGKFWTVDTLFYTYNYVNTTAYFVYLLFQNIDWMKHNEAGGVPSLSKNIIYKLKAFFPSLAEQQKIAECLSSMDDLIAAASAELEALKDHKKGLMQQLFPEPAK